MSKRLPSLESLRFVEACVRHGNFTRAAAELGVTPTAVSLRIRDLEAELGAELFHRSGPRITATEAGAALAGRIGEALEQIRLAVEAFRGGDHALRVTCAPTFGMRWLAPRLARYHALPDAVPIALDVAAELRLAPGFRRCRSHGAWRVARIPSDRIVCGRSDSHAQPGASGRETTVIAGGPGFAAAPAL